MTKEHFLAGKDASLEATIRRLRTRLKALGFHVQERAWLHPLDDIWSVHLFDRDCPLLFSNGKGQSRLAARASALGEFFERLSCRYFWSNYYLGQTFAQADFVHDPRERWFALPKNKERMRWPTELLNPALRTLFNPEKSIPAHALCDFNSGIPERGICALPFTCLSDKKTVWIPVNILGNLYVSNGMAAGNTPAEARVQALCEIIERHVKYRVVLNDLCLPDVAENLLNEWPRLAQGITDLRAAGFGLFVKDASLGEGFPVTCVILLDPQTQGCYASFGAHPRFEVALERALSELLQGRALDALHEFPEPSFDRDEVANAANLEAHFIDSSGTLSWRLLANTPDFAASTWPQERSEKTTNDDCAALCQLIQAKGYEIYRADFDHLGVYACRLIVPGFSEIYPLDDLEFENNNQAIVLRSWLCQVPDLSEADCAALLDCLNRLGIEETRAVASLIGLVADAGSAWENLRVGELKTLLALALGDNEQILEGCFSVHHSEALDPQRRRVYRCIESLLRLAEEQQLEHSQSALQALYGSTTLELAKALLSRKERFFGLTLLGENFSGSQMHQRLLAAYQKQKLQTEISNKIK